MQISMWLSVSVSRKSKAMSSNFFLHIMCRYTETCTTQIAMFFLCIVHSVNVLACEGAFFFVKQAPCQQAAVYSTANGTRICSSASTQTHVT